MQETGLAMQSAILAIRFRWGAAMLAAPQTVTPTAAVAAIAVEGVSFMGGEFGVMVYVRLQASRKIFGLWAARASIRSIASCSSLSV